MYNEIARSELMISPEPPLWALLFGGWEETIVPGQNPGEHAGEISSWAEE